MLGCVRLRIAQLFARADMTNRIALFTLGGLLLAISGCGVWDDTFGGKKAAIGADRVEQCSPARAPGVFTAVNGGTVSCVPNCPVGSYCGSDGKCRADCDADHMLCS